MNETPVWAHVVLDTVERAKKMFIPMKAAGHKKVRVTVC